MTGSIGGPGLGSGVGSGAGEGAGSAGGAVSDGAGSDGTGSGSTGGGSEGVGSGTTGGGSEGVGVDDALGSGLVDGVVPVSPVLPVEVLPEPGWVASAALGAVPVEVLGPVPPASVGFVAPTGELGVVVVLRGTVPSGRRGAGSTRGM